MSKTKELFDQADALAEKWFSEGGAKKLVTFAAAAHLLAGRCLREVLMSGSAREKYAQRFQSLMEHAQDHAKAFASAAEHVLVTPVKPAAAAAVVIMSSALTVSEGDPDIAWLVLRIAMDILREVGGIPNEFCVTVEPKIQEHMPAILAKVRAMRARAEFLDPREFAEEFSALEWKFTSKGGDA